MTRAKVWITASIVVAIASVATLLGAQARRGEGEPTLPPELGVLAQRVERLDLDGLDYRVGTFVVRDDPGGVRAALARACDGTLAVRAELCVCVGAGATLGPVHVVRGDETGSVVHVVERMGPVPVDRGSMPSVPATASHTAIAEGGLSWRESPLSDDETLAATRDRWLREGWSAVGSANGVEHFVRREDAMDVVVSPAGDAVTVWTAR